MRNSAILLLTLAGTVLAMGDGGNWIDPLSKRECLYDQWCVRWAMPTLPYTPFTDPGWTPCFPAAAGIVMDAGGLLSHGSIVAREYGIPAVVNISSATKIVKTGQRLRVDGTAGLVRILASS